MLNTNEITFNLKLFPGKGLLQQQQKIINSHEKALFTCYSSITKSVFNTHISDHLSLVMEKALSWVFQTIIESLLFCLYCNFKRLWDSSSHFLCQTGNKIVFKHCYRGLSHTQIIPVFKKKKKSNTSKIADAQFSINYYCHLHSGSLW